MTSSEQALAESGKEKNPFKKVPQNQAQGGAAISRDRLGVRGGRKDKTDADVLCGERP